MVYQQKKKDIYCCEEDNLDFNYYVK